MVSAIITTPDDATADRLTAELMRHQDAFGTGQVRKYLSVFAREAEEYRTYLHYPWLHLPRTSNAAEALVGIVRRVLSRAHGFRTAASLFRWIQATLKEHRTAACNGSAPTELLR